MKFATLFALPILAAGLVSAQGGTTAPGTSNTTALTGSGTGTGTTATTTSTSESSHSKSSQSQTPSTHAPSTHTSTTSTPVAKPTTSGSSKSGAIGLQVKGKGTIVGGVTLGLAAGAMAILV